MTSTWDVSCSTPLSTSQEGYMNFPLVCKQGDSKQVRVAFSSPVAGLVVRGSVRTGYQDDVGSTDILDFSVAEEVVGQTFLLTALPVDTEAAAPGEYVYDIEYEIAAANINKTFMGGTFVIEQQVTANA